MAFPSYVPTRTVSLSGGYLDPGIAAAVTLSVTIRSSLDLVWIATGFAFNQMVSTYTSSPPALWQATIPTTDATGWEDAATGLPLTSPTHLYTATIEFVSPVGGETVPAVTIGPFPLPLGDGSLVNLDILYPGSPPTGVIPDIWGSISQARAATLYTTDASMLTAGTLTDARLPVTSQAATVANASNLTTGTVADARLPGSAQAATLSATYVRKDALFVNVMDYGAVGDGVADDTAAFSAAIDYANGRNVGVVDAANVIGTTIFVPVGRYEITSAVHPILKSGCDIRGAGNNGSVLLLSYNGATFAFGNGTSDLVVGGSVSDLKIEYLAAPGSSAVVFHIENASRISFENILMVNVGVLADLGVSAARYASALDFSFIRGYVYNGGQPMIRANYGAGLSMTNCRAFVGGIATPTADRTSVMTTASGTDVVQVAVGGWDTVHMTGCFFERFDHGLYVSAASGVVINDIFISNTYFDYHHRQPIWLGALSGGFVGGVNIDNCWIASWDDVGIQLVGPGVVRGVSIANTRVVSAGTHGISVGSGVLEISIADCQIAGVNRTNVNAYGILLLAGSHVTIDNVLSGYDSTWAGLPWQAYKGIGIAADLDHVTITGCDAAGTAGGFDLGANSAGSVNRLVWGNRGANYAGYTALTLPASGATVTNTTPNVWDVSIYGGTVTGISKNGTGISGMTSGSLRIGPGETFGLTYSSAPSVTRFVQA